MSTLRGMDNIQEQIRVLETSVRRQRFAIVALASILAGSALIGAARPAGDATFDTITCKEWSVVDKSGKERISASTDAKGTAAVVWSDKDGKTRIGAATFADGATSVQWFDKDEKLRISADTTADGNAAVLWSDKDGKTRIRARTNADGTVIYPTKDLN